MRPIPKTLRDKIASDPYMSICARSKEGTCSIDRITWEHAWIYAGQQINEQWAVLPLCIFHHLGNGLDKKLNQYLSLRRATKEDLLKYPRKDWDTEWKLLSEKYKNYA